MIARILAIALTLVVASGDAAAQSMGDLDALGACQREEDASIRLRCFDRAVATLLSARDAGRVVVIDRDILQKRRRERFGLPPGLTSPDGTAAVQHIDSTVRSARQSEPGRWSLGLADGSVWQTVEPMTRVPAIGAPVAVNSAALGGYRLSVNRGRAVLAKRVR